MTRSSTAWIRTRPRCSTGKTERSHSASRHTEDTGMVSAFAVRLRHRSVSMARRKKKNHNSPSKENPFGGFIEVGRDHLIARMALLKTVLLRRASRKDLTTVHFDVKSD